MAILLIYANEKIVSLFIEHTITISRCSNILGLQAKTYHWRQWRRMHFNSLFEWFLDNLKAWCN